MVIGAIVPDRTRYSRNRKTHAVPLVVRVPSCYGVMQHRIAFHIITYHRSKTQPGNGLKSTSVQHIVYRRLRRVGRARVAIALLCCTPISYTEGQPQPQSIRPRFCRALCAKCFGAAMGCRVGMASHSAVRLPGTDLPKLRKPSQSSSPAPDVPGQDATQTGAKGWGACPWRGSPIIWQRGNRGKDCRTRTSPD